MTIKNDATAPSTTITSPAGGSTVSGTIAVQASATDNVAVTRVELYRNGVLIGTDTLSPYTFSWNTAQIADGSYTLQSKAYDAANNVGVSSLITVNVNNVNDNVPPAVSISNPMNNVPRKSTVTITASATDNVDVTKVEFYVDNVLTCIDTTESFTCEWKVPAKPRVTYVLEAIAYDTSGNVGYAMSEVISKK